ncbi:MAG: DotU family type IV/VI secretion system protein [Candidatus Latescibacterota bacterium]
MRLVEYFFEIFYYTSFLKSLDFSQLPYDSVAKRYKQILSASLNAARRDGVSERDWGQGLFPVCAWVDETVLCSDWPEREQWQQNPLQFVFFKTMNAGEDFFSRLSALDSDARDVREVYAYSLSLGFKGRYFQEKDADALAETVRSNLALITGNSGLEFPRTYFPEAYSEAEELRKPRPLRRGFSPVTLAVILLPALILTIFIALFHGDLSEKMLLLFKGL